MVTKIRWWWIERMGDMHLNVVNMDKGDGIMVET